MRYVSNRNKIEAAPNLEAVMLGVGNVVAAVFAGPGGCSEIGLTLINLNSGGKNRVSGVSAAVLTLVITYAAAPLINAV